MKVVSALIIGLCAIFAASLLSEGLMGLRTADRYVTVKGVAEREVQADLALWPIRFVATGSTLDEAQNKTRSSREAIMAFLKLQAIEESSVELQRLDVTDTRANPYSGNNNEQQYIINQTLMVRSTDMSDYGPGGPTYLFSGLNAIKPQMIAEATAAARESAQQFARDADAELGGLRRANQGIFQILARDQAPGVSEQQHAEFRGQPGDQRHRRCASAPVFSHR